MGVQKWSDGNGNGSETIRVTAKLQIVVVPEQRGN